MSARSKKIIDNFNRKVEELEHRSKQLQGEEEIYYQKELRFGRLRQERAEYRKTRSARHPWWFRYGDGRLADDWFRECLYFPADNPTKEEQEFYKEIVQEFVNNKKKKNNKTFSFHLESTKEAFWQWYGDQLSLESDMECFPSHQHSDHDFYHDQLGQQDYYYNPTIYGPKGDSQNFLWNLAFKDESDTEHLENKRELEPYFQDQERRRRQQRQQLRPDHE